VRFVAVHARRFDIIKAVPRAVKIAPETQVAHHRLAFQRLAARDRAQRLEMGFADQNGFVTVG